MARVVNDEDYFNTTRGVKEIYPYDEWTDGKARILTRGEDFDDTVEAVSVLAAIRKGMAKRGFKVTGRPLSDDEVLFKVVEK